MKFFILLPFIIAGIVVVVLTVFACYKIATYKCRPTHLNGLDIVLSARINNLLYYNMTHRVVMQMKSGETLSGTAAFLNGRLTGIICDNGCEIIRESIPREYVKEMEREELNKVGQKKEVK